MTITYTAQVATSSFGTFARLLGRWKGSIYKLVWKEFLIFMGAFYVLNFVYRFALNQDQKRIFERVSRYCEAYNALIPVAFVLGFYVSIVITRWWDQFMLIPWPDRMAMFVTANVHGHDERGRLMRRTIMRYLCLSYVITMSSISPVVKMRFPKFQHMTDAGFMMPNEQKIMEEIQTSHNKYFVPLAWATSLIGRARKEQRIKDDHAVKTLIDEVNAFRGQLGGLFNYDWISIPLVYTQVVTLATYTFFLSCLMGRQFVEKGGTVADMYVPVFTFLQFFFYMGWLKVAESLVNPFGEDDDDFDINSVIDRNLQVSYLVVDEMHQEHPELIKDQYWDEVDFQPPYTAAAAPFMNLEPHLGSAMSISVHPDEAEFVELDTIIEDDELREVNTGHMDIPKIIRAGSKRHVGSKNTPQGLGRSPSKGSSRFLHRLRRSSSKGSKPSLRTDPGSNMGSCSRLGSEMSMSPTSIREHEEIFNMSDLESIQTEQILEAATPENTANILDLLNKRLQSHNTQAAKKQASSEQQDLFSSDEDVTKAEHMKSRHRFRSGHSEASQVSTGTIKAVNLHIEDTNGGKEQASPPKMKPSSLSKQASPSGGYFKDTGTPKDSPDLSKKTSVNGGTDYDTQREKIMASNDNNLPQETVAAFEDLKLQQEREHGAAGVSRSTSVACEDVGKSLKLQQAPTLGNKILPRKRSASEGPLLGQHDDS